MSDHSRHERTVTRIAYRVPEFAEAIGVSRSKAYDLLQRGVVRSVRCGGCVRVPLAEIEAWLARELAVREPGR